MDWLGIDCAPESKPQNPYSEFACGFAGGVDDFAKNYRDMRNANTKGADQFFHCNANCESAQRGPGGELAAGLISIGREVIDTPKNVLGKGMSIGASLRDSGSDLHADRVGFEAGRSGLRCYDVCRAGFPYKGM